MPSMTVGEVRLVIPGFRRGGCTDFAACGWDRVEQGRWSRCTAIAGRGRFSAFSVGNSAPATVVPFGSGGISKSILADVWLSQTSRMLSVLSALGMAESVLPLSVISSAFGSGSPWFSGVSVSVASVETSLSKVVGVLVLEGKFWHFWSEMNRSWSGEELEWRWRERHRLH